MIAFRKSICKVLYVKKDEKGNMEVSGTGFFMSIKNNLKALISNSSNGILCGARLRIRIFFTLEFPIPIFL